MRQSGESKGWRGRVRAQMQVQAHGSAGICSTWQARHATLGRAPLQGMLRCQAPAWGATAGPGLLFSHRTVRHRPAPMPSPCGHHLGVPGDVGAHVLGADVGVVGGAHAAAAHADGACTPGRVGRWLRGQTEALQEGRRRAAGATAASASTTALRGAARTSTSTLATALRALTALAGHATGAAVGLVNKDVPAHALHRCSRHGGKPWRPCMWLACVHPPACA